MRDVFNEQLHELLTQLLLMGGKADEMVGLAVRSLVERNESLADEVYSRERQVNELQMEIDRRAVNITTQHQPVASDLRLVFAATKIATDVERIADQAVNICQSAPFVLQFPPCDPISLVQELANLVRKMVADAMASMDRRDCQLAEAVLQDDARADRLRDDIFRALLTYMITDPLTTQRSLSLVLISRNLERVGDHAANIAEEVIYVVRGEDVRHQYDRPVCKPAGSPSTMIGDERVIQTHGIIIDSARREVFLEGRPVTLSESEFLLLWFLAGRPGVANSRQQIIDALQGPEYPVTVRSVDVQVVGLRKKLGVLGELIETVRGVGYRFRE